jgi:hypothetical protein
LFKSRQIVVTKQKSKRRYPAGKNYIAGPATGQLRSFVAQLCTALVGMDPTPNLSERWNFGAI